MPHSPPLVVSFAGVFGGAERLLADIASGLPEPPVLACPPGPLAEAARAHGLGVFELRPRSLELRRGARDRAAAPLRVAGQAAEVRELAAALEPTALVAWGMRAALVLSVAFPGGRGRPPLLFQHNDLLPGPWIARAVRAAARGADRVVAPSDCVARDLAPGNATVDVVHPGVDLDRFRPAAESGPRPAPDTGPRRLEVLWLGAIEPWKRPDLALEAVAVAARDLPELTLRVGGEPIGSAGIELLRRLRHRASEPDLSGRVVFAGRIDEPERALREAACLIQSSDREPYGIVVAEALASGTPVVAPDACGPAEIAHPDCARLYEPGDAEAAGRALLEIAADPGTTAAMGKAARARAEERLDLERTRARYAELLEELAPSARAPHRPREAGEQLAVVTVLHNSERELHALLSSLERVLPAAQVIVVDSGSTDGGAELARSWRDGAARVVELGDNLGFGRGANAGLELADRPVTALLNPDVELPDASLDAAARAALSWPERILAPLVLRPDGTREDNAQLEPGSPVLVAQALVPGAALPRRVAAALEPWRSARPRHAGWPVGSCLVARTELLRRLGPFDDRAFLYAEDLDLGLRAADAGVETWFWPGARVVHHGAHASRRAFDGEPFELLASRRREVVRERRGARRAAIDDALQAITFADRIVLKRLTGRDAGRERRQLRALREARRKR